jgi:hypothetical protein
MTDEEPVDSFYTAERWGNWLDRIRESEIDPEGEESARLLFNVQDDAAIAVAKLLAAHDDDRLDDETAVEELRSVRDVVLAEPPDEFDEDALVLIDSVQTSLFPVFYAAEEYLVGGPAEGEPEAHVRAAVAADAEDDPDAALGHLVRAGTLVIDGAEFAAAEFDVDYGLVAEWLSGLESLAAALADPEVIEE